MAKKRKKDKEEKQEYEFKPPEFDEKEFLQKELRDTKTVILTVAYAATFGIVAGLLSNLDDALVYVGLALLFGGLLSLKYVYPMLKIDISTFQKKNWAGNVAWFFLTFLAVWVLVLNFPFADHAKPSVSELTVWVDSGTNVTALDYKFVDSTQSWMWVERWGADAGSVIHAAASYTINITARVADNGDLTSVLISVSGGELTAMPYEGEHRYGFTLTGDQVSSGSLSFTIRATDEAGHERVVTPVAITVLA